MSVLRGNVPLVWMLAVLLFLIVVWGWYSSSLLMRLSRYPTQAIPSDFSVPFEEVAFTSKDGVKLAGWFLPAATRSDTTIVMAHGWGANKSDILPTTMFLNTLGGYNLFYFDFRCHGESGGQYSSLVAQETWDLEAAIDYVRREKPDQARRLALFGLSMGGAVSLSVAARRPEMEAVVSESAFSSFREVVARFGWLFYHVPRYPLVPITLFFIRLRLGLDPEPFSPIHHIGKIAPRPVFLIQGDSDARMPPTEGERLFAAAQEPKTLWTIPGADHGEPASAAGQEYEDRILEFFKEAFAKK